MNGKSEIRAYFYFGEVLQYHWDCKSLTYMIGAMTPEELGENHVNGLNSLMGGNHYPNDLGKLYIY